MARGSKSSKLAAARAAGPSKPSTTTGISTAQTSQSQSTKTSQISAQLRQAVKDLGGDDEDLDLIAGLGESDDEGAADAGAVASKSGSGKVDEKSLKKELGAFMKGLDFSTGPVENSDDEEEEEQGSEGSEGSSEDDDDGDDDEEEQEDEDEEEEDDDDDDPEEDEEDDPEPAPAKQTNGQDQAHTAQDTKTSARSLAQDEESGSAKNVPATPQWETLAPSLLPLASAPSTATLTHFQLNGLRQKATRLLDELPPLSRASSSSDAAFISQILQSGTHQDKLSALVLIVRESPVHAVKELSRLRAMTGWKEDGTVGGGGNKDQRVAVMKALADWWVSGGGKEKGKLRYFADQPLLAHPQLTDRHLLLFAFEDFLKKWFFNFLQVLETLSHDTLPFIRTQALHIIFRCLSGNAEQEQNLLRLGVNKLGDTDKPVASKASHHLLQLLQAHPAMKAIVAREVAALVLKPNNASSAAAGGASSASHTRFDDDDNTKPKGKGKGKKGSAPGAAGSKPETTGHARYYGLITLNQITLTRKDQEVAGKLVELYFEVFREILGEMNKAEDESAQPTADADADGAGHENDAEDGEAVNEGKIAQAVGKVDKWRGRRKGTRTKAGRKSALESEEDLIDANEARLVAAVLTGINRALPYAQLDEGLFEGYMSTLFKITHAGTFNTSIQALNLIFQVAQSRQAVSDRFYRTLYDSLFDGRIITSSKQAMYLNLLFKALKADKNTARVMAFVKRLLQMLGMHQPPFICGALYLLGELFNFTPGLKRMLIEPEDDGEEHFVDADVKTHLQAHGTKVSNKEYDGKKREPQYANADSSCLWELVPFLNHFHPSVSLQANQLLLSQPLTGSSDISLNTLVSFLDRFVYRNPKKTLQPKGASIMQPAAASDQSGMVVNHRGARTGGEGVNSEAFWRKKIEDVPVEMMFFHRYFSERLARKEKAGLEKGKKKDVDDEDEDEKVASAEEDEEEEEQDEPEEESEQEDEELPSEEDSDAEEAEIWKAMKASMPRAQDNTGLSEDEDEFSDEEFSVSASSASSESGSESESADAASVKGQVKGKGKGKAVQSAFEPEDDELPDDDEEMESADEFPSFDEDEDDLIDEDEMDLPDIVLSAKNDDDEEEGDEEEEGEEGKKRKRRDERKERRKKRKEMPLFGSYEDYAKLIEEGGSGEDY